MMDRMGIYHRLGSMKISGRKPRLTRTVSLNRLRRFIRCQAGSLGLPNTNTRQIILNRMDRLTRMNMMPRLARVTRLPIHTRLNRMTSITSLTRKTILTRMLDTTRRTKNV